MSIDIRAASLEDLPVLKAFEQGIVLAERPYDPTIKADPVSYYDLADYIRSEDAEVIVAEQSGEIVGSGSVIKKQSRHYQIPEYHAYLGFMFVPEKHRGKGINKLIMAELLSWAKKQGFTEVRLTVYSENTPAIRAYEKVGFQGYMTEMRLKI